MNRKLTAVYSGKRVLVTGHTGFKGSWLTEWLLMLGANVMGFSLPARPEAELFAQLGLAERINHQIGDIRDLQAICRTVAEFRPEFIFHLAAQPLVRQSYEEPVETYATNIMGTAHVLESVRLPRLPCIVVAVTTDKCYENKEWTYAYREEDPLGGYDPYSSSKAAAEVVINSYRLSYFSSPDTLVHLASARAGNVVGGGDWARDRIVPDCIRALLRNDAIAVRNKRSRRPWQHVLEPLSGYLLLAASIFQANLDQNIARRRILCSAFNFGPGLDSNRSVSDLVVEILKNWPGTWRDESDLRAVHEAKLLQLAIEKASLLLGWRPIWSFEETVRRTTAWYRQNADGNSGLAQLTRDQIAAYSADASDVDWGAPL